jgi:hypothetical protein
LLHTAASVKFFFVYSEGALKLINGNCIQVPRFLNQTNYIIKFIRERS